MRISHKVQIKILRSLLFSPNSKYSDLDKNYQNIDNFSFHLKKLLSESLVEKVGDTYRLTSLGLAEAEKIGIKQPKVGVLICVTRTIDGESEVLLGERLKDPGKGKVGFFATKVNAGETIISAGQRCLLKETGLTAKFTYSGVVNIIDTKTSLHRLMVYLKADSPNGEMVKKTKESLNYWVKHSSLHDLPGTFDDFPEDVKLFEQSAVFIEERSI